MRRLVVPSGLEREVLPSGLMVSATDGEGIVQHADAALLELSAMTPDDLLGWPHQVLRHPELPGGLFHLLWQYLGAGLPACAYLKNLAADGAQYWMFTAFVPVGGQFLAVHRRPAATLAGRDPTSLLNDVYRRVRAAELKLRGRGHNAQQCAEQGAELLQDELAQWGLESYVDLMVTALPAEVAARDDATQDNAAGSASEGLRRAQEHVQEVIAATRRVADVMRRLEGCLTRARSLLDEHQPQVVAATTSNPSIASSAIGIGGAVTTVAGQLQEVRGELSDTLFRRREIAFQLALVQLQRLTVVERFDSTPALLVDGLLGTISQTLDVLGQELAWNSSATSDWATRVPQVHREVAQVASLLSNWRLMAVRHGLAHELAPLLAGADRTLEPLNAGLAELLEAGATLRALAVQVDLAALRQELTRLPAGSPEPA